METRLLNNDYDAIAQKIRNLSQDITFIKRQSDLIGGIDDTATFRKQVIFLSYHLEICTKFILISQKIIQ